MAKFDVFRLHVTLYSAKCSDPVLVYCWASVVDSAPALRQHWIFLWVYFVRVYGITATEYSLVTAGLHNEVVS